MISGSTRLLDWKGAAVQRVLRSVCTALFQYIGLTVCGGRNCAIGAAWVSRHSYECAKKVVLHCAA